MRKHQISIDDDISNMYHDVNNRELTEKEVKLVDEYFI
jgi:hypothetical protein